MAAYGMQAMQSTTYVDEVFGGKIVSSVTCLECQEVRGHIQHTHTHTHIHVVYNCTCTVVHNYST